MRRVHATVRPDWLRLVEDQGLTYAVDRHGADGGSQYWDESVRYEFSEAQIDHLERVTGELHDMAVQAARHMVDDPALMARFRLTRDATDWLRRSLADPADLPMYGRFDLAWDGTGEPKLLEYNADTPAGLVEAAVCQWMWLEDLHPDVDQWNLIHELLQRFWRRLAASGGTTVHFTAGQHEPSEDWATVAYLRDVAAECGITDLGMTMEDVGWDHARQRFVDLREVEISHCFKMFPTEWMINSPFGDYLVSGQSRTRWIEPPWKMLLGSKALLVTMWQMFPGHPNLVPAQFDSPAGMSAYAVKPMFGWEGDGIRIVHPQHPSAAPARLTAGQDVVYQEYVDLGDFDGAHPVLGTWVVDGMAAGLGIRESRDLITTTSARFVPHLITAPRSTPDQVQSWVHQTSPGHQPR